jgi:hypothetical protein
MQALSQLSYGPITGFDGAVSGEGRPAAVRLA